VYSIFANECRYSTVLKSGIDSLTDYKSHPKRQYSLGFYCNIGIHNRGLLSLLSAINIALNRQILLKYIPHLIWYRYSQMCFCIWNKVIMYAKLLKCACAEYSTRDTKMSDLPNLLKTFMSLCFRGLYLMYSVSFHVLVALFVEVVSIFRHILQPPFSGWWRRNKDVKTMSRNRNKGVGPTDGRRYTTTNSQYKYKWDIRTFN
jgi:hypothetical protein